MPRTIQRNYFNTWMYRQPKIIPKIEKPLALQHIDAILERSFGLMIARGDMATEAGLEHMPAIQKFLTAKCVAADKMCICATQVVISLHRSVEIIALDGCHFSAFAAAFRRHLLLPVHTSP